MRSWAEIAQKLLSFEETAERGLMISGGEKQWLVARVILKDSGNSIFR